MKTIYLQNWKFSLEKNAGSLYPWTPGFDDSNWQNVIVPHDWAVSFPFSSEYSSGTGYLPGGTGWYRTHLIYIHCILEVMRVVLQKVKAVL
jgi:hypothetical protein